MGMESSQMSDESQCGQTNARVVFLRRAENLMATKTPRLLDLKTSRNERNSELVSRCLDPETPPEVRPLGAPNTSWEGIWRILEA